MLWPKFVLLLLLPLGLGGCWEGSMRLRPPATASSSQNWPPPLAGDDLPTPRFFQIERSVGSSD